MLGRTDQDKETGLEPKRVGIQQKRLLLDHTGLSHFANPIPDRRLGTTHDLGDIVQGLAAILLQLHKDFSIQIIYSDRHSAFPSISGTEHFYLFEA